VPRSRINAAAVCARQRHRLGVALERAALRALAYGWYRSREMRRKIWWRQSTGLGGALQIEGVKV
jgi:hypothetical protein